eukprot:4377637-Pyramimonas_sp.AAC.1
MSTDALWTACGTSIPELRFWRRGKGRMLEMVGVVASVKVGKVCRTVACVGWPDGRLVAVAL